MWSLKSAQNLASSTTLSEDNLYSEDSGDGHGFADLIKRSDIEAVVIALPIINQPAYIRQALTAGKHVLSEKPIAENVEDAQDLISWYHTTVDTTRVFWSVAENYRYLNSFDYARRQLQCLGRIGPPNKPSPPGSIDTSHKQASSRPMYPYTKSVTDQNPVRPAGTDTPWRKTPTHQGGFLLDGGVHFAAALRLLLGPSDPIVRLSAYTTQLQPHLPPVDTVAASLQTQSGATGTFSLSFGTSLRDCEWVVACKGGCVRVSLLGAVPTVTTIVVGGGESGEEKKEQVEVANERTGVPPEVRKWTEALVAGRRNDRQMPEEALADLELVSGWIFRSAIVIVILYSSPSPSSTPTGCEG
ncbi:MAG: hypothetical protein Q9187_007529 [Circinaria calcarea]